MYLNVLIADDSEDDALLLVRELRRGGYQPQFERVDTRDDMEKALDQRHWQLIITDHTMPGFNSADVLEMVKRSGLDVPVIIVSGTIGEEAAVHAMKAVAVRVRRYARRAADAGNDGDVLRRLADFRERLRHRAQHRIVAAAGAPDRLVARFVRSRGARRRGTAACRLRADRGEAAAA